MSRVCDTGAPTDLKHSRCRGRAAKSTRDQPRDMGSHGTGATA